MSSSTTTGTTDNSGAVAISGEDTEESPSTSATKDTQQGRRKTNNKKKIVVIPPNLTFDPRSSFAPVIRQTAAKEDASDDEEDEDDEDDGDDDEKIDDKKDDKKDDSTDDSSTEREPGKTMVANRVEKDEEDVVDRSGEEEEAADEDEDKSEGEGEEDEDDDDEEWMEEEELLLPDPDVVYAIPLPDRLHVKIHSLFAGGGSSTAPEEVGTVWLDENVFGKDPVRVDLIKRAVNYFRAKKRGRRTAKTKTIGEVRGSGRKIRRQKGTGKARVGHSRPPHHRGGAKAHGPKNTTDYGNTKLNKKVRKQALANALSQKLLEGNLIVLDQLHELPTHKTGDLVRLLKPLKIGGATKWGSTALIVDHYYYDNDNDDNDDNNDDRGEDDDHDEDQQEEKTTTTATTTAATTAIAATHNNKSYRGVPANLWAASSNLYKIKVANDHGANVYDILKHEKLVLTLGALEQLEGRLKNI